MAVKFLVSLFGHAVGVIVRDISYDIERRLVEKNLASYTLTGGTTQTKPTQGVDTSAVEKYLVDTTNEVVSDSQNPPGLQAPVSGARIGNIASGSAIPDHYYGGIFAYLRSELPRKIYAKGNTIKLQFMLMQSGSTSEVVFAGTCQIQSYITIRGVSYLVTFGGASSGIGTMGTLFESDLITLPVTYQEGEEILETTQVKWTSSNFLCFRNSPQWFGESGWVSVGRSSGAWTDFVVTSGRVETPAAGSGWTTANDANYFGAYFASSAILGYQTKGTVAILGDSRERLAAGDQLNHCLHDRYGVTGQVASYCHANGIPHINLGWSGESYTRCTAGGAMTQRALFAAPATVVVDAMGFNDIGAGANYASTSASSTGTSITGAAVTGATPAIGMFVTGATVRPGTRITNVTGTVGNYTLTIDKSLISATTAFNVNASVTYTLAAWQAFIKAMRNILNAWDIPYLHNTMLPYITLTTDGSAAGTSAATPSVNYFNWLLKSGQLNAPIDRGDGVVQRLIDGYVDGAVALDAGGGQGILKAAAKAQTLTGGGGAGINTTSGSDLLYSPTGRFTPAMDGEFFLIPTVAEGILNYMNANYALLSTPRAYGPNLQTLATDTVRRTAGVRTWASSTLTDQTAYISPPNKWYLDDKHLREAGEREVTLNGDFAQLKRLF